MHVCIYIYTLYTYTHTCTNYEHIHTQTESHIQAQVLALTCLRSGRVGLDCSCGSVNADRLKKSELPQPYGLYKLSGVRLADV